MIKKLLIGKKYIEGIIRGYVHSFTIQGERGIGKTELVFNTLKELGLEENVHYKYIANYITPKGLVQLLDKVNKLEPPRILVMDDIEKCLQNAQLVGILKSALWVAGGHRRITWITSKENTNFDFTGKVILLVNEMNKSNSFVNALMDRGYYLNISLSPLEKIEMMKERIKEPYQNLSYKQRLKIWESIKEFGTRSDKLSLRSLEKGYNLFLISPNHFIHLIKNQLLS